MEILDEANLHIGKTKEVVGRNPTSPPDILTRMSMGTPDTTLIKNHNNSM